MARHGDLALTPHPHVVPLSVAAQLPSMFSELSLKLPAFHGEILHQSV
jgi:hypothetical protein